MIDRDATVPQDVASAYIVWADNLAPQRSPDFLPEQHLQYAKNATRPSDAGLQYVWAASAFLSQPNYVGGAAPIEHLLSQAAKCRAESGLRQDASELETLAAGAEHVVRISAMYRSEVLGLEANLYPEYKGLDFNNPVWLREGAY